MKLLYIRVFIIILIIYCVTDIILVYINNFSDYYLVNVCGNFLID